MNGMFDINSPGDAELVAYLDGALSPEERTTLDLALAHDAALRERLAVLAAGNREFHAAFDPLLNEAPLRALMAGLDEAVAATGAPRARTVSRPAILLAALAAGIALFVAGVAVQRLLLAEPAEVAEHEPEAGTGWRVAVAAYFNLYTVETFADVPDDAAQRARELATLQSRLGVPLSAERVELPELALKRSQLFDYDGKTLGQIAYLDPATGPVALCIIRAGGADAAPRSEVRDGLNVVYWTRAGRGYMLVGRLPGDRLGGLANALAARLAS